MALNVKRELIDEVLSWPEVTEQPHRFGGVEFGYRGKEIGHLHGDRLVDLLLPKSARDRAVAEGRAKPHHIYPDSGWVSIYLNSESEIAAAVGLLRFNYERLAAKAAGGNDSH